MEDIDCRVGSPPPPPPPPPEARPVLTSGETEVRGMWEFPPGKTPGARKVGVSRARPE